MYMEIIQIYQGDNWTKICPDVLHLCFSAWQQLNWPQVLHLHLTCPLHVRFWVSAAECNPKEHEVPRLSA